MHGKSFIFLDVQRVTSYTSFRMVPTFGRDTIRKFSANVSDLSKLAARDFEDILQVCGSSDAIYQQTLIRLSV